MVVSLQIKKVNLDLILLGKKKTEWREYSLYNKNKLFTKREDGKFDGNKEITHIKFINGYQKEAPTLMVECVGIRLVKFSRDINIIEDNFSALEGQFSIEIKLGNIAITT